MNNNFYFFFSNKSLLNEVTTVYVKAIEEALKDLGYTIIYTYDYKSIPPHSKIFTIIDKCNFTVLSHCKPELCINWYQGIVPEEAALSYADSITKYPRVWYHNYLEKYTLRRNAMNLFVSDRMQEHYRKKYGLDINNGFIMPCFNCDLDESSFTADRYEKPTFVYAGSMAKWQCAEPMMKAFKHLKKHLPDAKLAVFTRQTDEARRIAEDLGIEVEIDSLTPEELNQRLKEFKYGLLFRDDIAVNNVATPTKINNYMACGLIPVFSDVIDDYRKISKNNPYIITFENEDDFVKKIVEMEKIRISSESLLDAHRETFRSYWNIPAYKEQFKERMKNIPGK